MEALAQLMTPQILSIFIPILAIIALFIYMAAKAYFRHVERLEKIRNGIDPDAEKEDS